MQDMSDHPVIALEQAALERWCNGDPDGFLDLCADDVVYFDPFLPARLDGFEQLKAHYDGLRGKIFAPRHTMIQPLVQTIGEVAVLTFRFVSYSSSEGAEMRWNCTEVYRQRSDRWQIIQTHWPFTAAGLG